MRKTIFVPEEYYHIYNHGVEDRKIFLANNDYRRFFLSLIIFNNPKSINQNLHRFTHNPILLKEISQDNKKRSLVNIIALTLLPNHYHLLVQERQNQGISRLMHRLGKGYSRYFNIKYKRTGTLWQGSFGAKRIDKQSYLVHIISYIHLNVLDLYFPQWREGKIKNWQEAERKIRGYPWSSYTYYRTRNKTSLMHQILTQPEWFPEHFPTPQSFEENLKLWSMRTNPLI